MVLGLAVKTHEPVGARLRTAFERATEPETRTPGDVDAFFSQQFVRDHTEFHSLDEFCRACPCKRDSIGGVKRLSPDERDDFVAATTEFESWAAMKTSAATTDLVTLTQA
ncbi:uncharacterized protein HHUB_1557 [Halobacterium hubeiense]|jgi:hypothetical protein|uniref:Uncharacterized protein n=2 Tax=Halobacterium TaxID=2239 RepID=A0A0U5HRZ5_9EURY|nr:hypothetical protein [Halobacterium hubeiense]CQH49751.1 uncharacterized protein HHUB_1557 [Halobacterium hubeiense]